jgi:hypothetical protein
MRQRLILLGAGTAIAGVLIGLIAAYDVHLHHKAHNLVNVWGYRGPVLGWKQPNEVRIAVLGGSTAYGYGVEWHQAFPAHLERILNGGAHGGQSSARVVNLGFMAEGAYSFAFTLRDFESLDYDVVCLYEGYNDLRGNLEANRWMPRRQSPIFRLTGYYPVLPIVIREKALLLRYGDLDAAYRGRQVVFHATVPQRVFASVLDAAVSSSEALGLAGPARRLEGFDRMLDEVERARESSRDERECGFWSSYCHSMTTAIDYALGNGKAVLVVTQPYLVDPTGRKLHIDQQRALAGMLARSYSRERRVRYLNLGDAVDLRDPVLTWDSMHLTSEGNERVARALAPTVQDLLRTPGR